MPVPTAPLLTLPTFTRRVLLPFLLALSLAALAGPVNVDASGLAIHGHDPVAYFTEGKAVAGRIEHEASHGGARYRFASETNRRRFEADPAMYLPQYGGYCAFGVAQGAKPDIDPQAFRIVDGRLYLNLSPAVQRRWAADIPGYIAAADRRWPALRDR